MDATSFCKLDGSVCMKFVFEIQGQLLFIYERHFSLARIILHASHKRRSPPMEDTLKICLSFRRITFSHESKSNEK